MATKPTAPETPPTKRRQQLAQTYRMAKRSDPRIGLYSLLGALVGGALGFLLLWILPGSGLVSTIITIVGTVLFAVLGGLLVFGRRAQAAAYQQMEGQPGAAAAALSMLKRGWKTDAAIGVTRQQDVVHRVVGPPGIVLIGEGNPTRVRGLLAAERRRHERVAADTPVHEVISGRGEGQVPIDKLVKHVQKLGRSVKPAEMTDVLNRLKAIDAHRSAIPLPKGPVPQSMKGLRGQQRGR